MSLHRHSSSRRPLLLYLAVHLAPSPGCLPTECCLVRNLFTINRTQIKAQLEHLTQVASFQAVYWRKRSRRRKGGSCVSTFDLSSLACAHLVQLRMPFLWNSCRQSDPWFLLGTGPSVRTTHSPEQSSLCAFCNLLSRQRRGVAQTRARNQRVRQFLRV